jgi:hypothetical protein
LPFFPLHLSVAYLLQSVPLGELPPGVLGELAGLAGFVSAGLVELVDEPKNPFGNPRLVTRSQYPSKTRKLGSPSSPSFAWIAIKDEHEQQQQQTTINNIITISIIVPSSPP